MRYIALILLTITLFASLSACGSGGGSSNTAASTRSSRATVTIQWPNRSRLIPSASNSIRIEIKNGASLIDQKLVARPANGGTATVSFDSLPVGTFTVVSTAYPQSDGTGTAQATASAPLVLQAGQNTSFALTMASTIDHLELTAPDPIILTGNGTQLSVLAKDASGAVVLLTPGKLQWTSSNSNIAVVDSTGIVTGALSGTANISVQDSESSKSASAAITVLLTVSIQPATSTITIGQTQAYTATINGNTNKAVTWSVQEGAAGGSITSSGIYTPPNQAGTYHIVAKSVADPTRKDTAVITVQTGSAAGTIQ